MLKDGLSAYRLSAICLRCVLVGRRNEQICSRYRSNSQHVGGVAESVTSLGPSRGCVCSPRSEPILGVMSSDWSWTGVLLSLAVVLRVTSQQADVTTTRHHVDESSVVNMTSSTPGQYVNPRPGEGANDSAIHLIVNIQLYWRI